MKRLVVLLLLGLLGPPASANDAKDILPWAQVSYRASKFFLTATVDVSLQKAEPAALNAALNTAGTHVPLMAGNHPQLLTTIDTQIAGQNTHIELWHGSDLQVLQRTALYTGRKNWLRMTRFAQNGIYSLKRRPAANETGNPPSQWSERNEDYYPYSRDIKAQAITEPETVFYALASSAIQQPGDLLELSIEQHGKPQRLAIRAEGKRKLDVDFERVEAQQSVRVKTVLDVLHVIMHPMDSTEDAKFLGLNGDIDLYFDPVSRLIIELKGNANVIGEVRFLLQRVTTQSIAR